MDTPSADLIRVTFHLRPNIAVNATGLGVPNLSYSMTPEVFTTLRSDWSRPRDTSEASPHSYQVVDREGIERMLLICLSDVLYID